MPPKKQDGLKKAGRKAPPKGKTCPRGMAKPISPGLVMTDLMKKQWKLGPVIGQGGFGYIYLGDTDSGSQVTAEDASYVIKVEPHANGPLFVELAFYQRVAKPDMVNSWMQSKKKSHIGIPLYIGTGSFENDGVKYRFMVMDRFGTDIEKLYAQYNYQFPEKTVFSLGIRILDALEYIHENEYVHADIKSSNLMMGFKKSHQSKIYLLDFGLAHRYCPNGKHTPYKEDPKRKHDGTIEYTSRDAHKGCAPSRRGDLEILGYCMVQWLCKKLPWEDKLTDKDYVMKQKVKYMDDIPEFMRKCFPSGNVPAQLQEYLNRIVKMAYDERPDYNKIKNLFADGLKECGISDDGATICLPTQSPTQQKRGKTVSNTGPSESESPRKRPRPSPQSTLPRNSPVKKSPETTGVRSSKNSTRKKTENKTSPSSQRKRRQRAATPVETKATQKAASPVKRTVQPTTTSVKSKTDSVNMNDTVEVHTNGTERIVHRRPRRKNVPTRDFAQSP